MSWLPVANSHGTLTAHLDRAEVLGPDGRVEVVEPLVGSMRRVVVHGLAVAGGGGVADVTRQLERRPTAADLLDQRVGRRGGPASVVGFVVAVAEPGLPRRRRLGAAALVGEGGEGERGP